MAREIAFSNGTRVVVGSQWAVTTLRTGADPAGPPRPSGLATATMSRR